MREIDSILIIAGAKSAGKIFLRREAKSHDFVLALDGGADTALKAGILPDMALGDLDSISQEAKKELGPRRLFKISRQDGTALPISALPYLHHRIWAQVADIYT